MSTSLRTTRSEHDPDRTAVGVEVGDMVEDGEDKGRVADGEGDEEHQREHEHDHDRAEENEKEDVEGKDEIPNPMPWERQEPPPGSKTARTRLGMGLVVDTTHLGNGNHTVEDDTRRVLFLLSISRKS